MRVILGVLTVTFLTACGQAYLNDEHAMAPQPAICEDLNSCAQRITLRVKNRSDWVCDDTAAGKKSVVLAEVDRSGSLVDSKLVESSKDRKFDKKSLETVANSAPFPEIRALSDADFIEAKDLNFTFLGGVGCAGKKEPARAK